MATKKPTLEATLPEDAVERAAAIAPIRLAALALAAKLDAAKLRTLKLERARVIAAEGDRSPRLQDIEDVFDSNVASVKTAALEIGRARLPPAKPEKERAVVHGRVVDKAGAGVSSVPVTAHDAAGKMLASVSSDETGYYYMTVAPPEGAASNISVRANNMTENARELEIAPGVLAILEMLVRD